MGDQLERLSPGALVEGVVPGAVVEIVRMTPVGANAVIYYRDEFGIEESRLLNPDQLAAVCPVDSGKPSLDADSDDFWLAVEALRLRHACLLNPLLAVSSSKVEALPHQVQAVYEYMLRNHPQRFLLADDPGAGKTIMAGLFIKEALARDWIRRCLVVVPGSLVEQWQQELQDKFALHFEIFDNLLLQGQSDDPLRDIPFLIARLDQFSRSKDLTNLVVDANYDLAIFDEAHKLSVSVWGATNDKTKRFKLAEAVRDAIPSTLLMTATPHNGVDAAYREFLTLLRTAGEPAITDPAGEGLMRRLVKEQLVYLDGSPLFPQRRASTVPYHLSPLERDLYEEVTEYVREEMNKVSDDDTKRNVGFALVVLQRRLASSPEAILRSLTRRHDRLQSEAARVRAADQRLAADLATSLGLKIPDPDDLSGQQAENYEDETVAVATAARTLEELETEILILDGLVKKAEKVHEARVDAKWEALAELLTSSEMYEENGQRRKIIIFSENRDTIVYLEGRLSELLGGGSDVEVIHGAMSWADRRRAQINFIEEPSSSILLATDAAGEGVNLQVAHLMVNYDVPWNPNRLEQRFGRIHRIGQRHTCHLWNLVAAETREGDVLRTLLEKLEVQRKALGDKVFDVLGEVLTDAKLSQLLTRAITGQVSRDKITQDLDRVSHDLASAANKRSELASTLTSEELTTLRRNMEIARAMSFQPHVAHDFTLRALPILHGDIASRGNGWRVGHVPARVRDGFGSSVMNHYDAVTFEHTESQVFGANSPELIAPGHPLLSALAKAVGEDFGSALTRGIILSDNRSSDDYALVSVVASTSGRPTAFDTYAVFGDGEHRPVSPALYTSLEVSSHTASPGEVDATETAVEAVIGERPDDQVAALAYVRGTASGEAAQAWRSAREHLHQKLIADGLDPLDVLPGQGWDFTTGDDEITFWSAALPGHTERRRAERHTASNVGARYVIVS